MYGIYANIWGILMGNVTIYSIHGSYGIDEYDETARFIQKKHGIFDDDLRYNR
jgi:hypothetical protein